MKTAQLKAILSEKAFEANQKFFNFEAAKRFNLRPVVKIWACCGGVEGFVSEFYEDEHGEIVYTADLADATVFFKLSITSSRTAKIKQVGYDKGYNDKDPIISMREFKQHDEQSWHIGFTGFDIFMDAFRIEAQAIGRLDAVKEVKDFYERDIRDTYDECNYSHYFPCHLYFFTPDKDNMYKLGDHKNGKLLGAITI